MSPSVPYGKLHGRRGPAEHPGTSHQIVQPIGGDDPAGNVLGIFQQ